MVALRRRSGLKNANVRKAKRLKGFALMKSVENPQDTVNTTVWETKEDMDVYNTSDGTSHKMF